MDVVQRKKDCTELLFKQANKCCVENDCIQLYK